MGPRRQPAAERRRIRGAVLVSARLTAAFVLLVLLAQLISLTGRRDALASQSIDPLRDSHGVVVNGHGPPPVSAKSWVIVDADSGDVLAAKDAHRRLRPAS